jgi:hypothetical protein
MSRFYQERLTTFPCFLRNYLERIQIVIINIQNIVTCICVARRDVGLEVGFINYFNTELVITLNYNATHSTDHCSIY